MCIFIGYIIYNYRGHPMVEPDKCLMKNDPLFYQIDV